MQQCCQNMQVRHRPEICCIEESRVEEEEELGRTATWEFTCLSHPRRTACSREFAVASLSLIKAISFLICLSLSSNFCFAEDRSARGLRSQKGQDVKGSAADTSPTIVSGDDTSHMQTSGGEPSRGGVSVVTLSGDGTPPDDSGDAPTSARRNVPVLNDAYLNPRGTHKKRIPMQCQV